MRKPWKETLLCTLLAASLLLGGCAQQSVPMVPETTATPEATATADPTAAPEATATAEPTATSAVAPDAEQTTQVAFFFDTVVTIRLYGAPEGLMEELIALCARYEALLSKTVEGSDVMRINEANGEPVTVDPETWQILVRAKEISDLTDHAFSVTIAPLSAMWDFTDGTNRKPTDEERVAALPLVNDDTMILGEDYTVQLAPGQSIDLGGIAKGYIADQLAAVCRERGVPALLNFGGNVYAEGIKPNNTDWAIGIRNPKTNDGSALAIVYVKDQTVVTSGTYERYFIEDDVLYHHILDPQTGLPATTDLASVSIVSHSSMDADAFATACVVLGAEKAVKLLEENGLAAMLIDTENKVSVTSALEAQYTWQLMETN